MRAGVLLNLVLALLLALPASGEAKLNPRVARAIKDRRPRLQVTLFHGRLIGFRVFHAI